MAETTNIEWCSHTWSPWQGCTKVSVGPQGGCVNCYAENRDQRFHGGKHWGPGAPRRRTVDWTKPRLWNRKAAAAGVRATVFPSLCDPFDNEVDPQWRADLFALIRATPSLTWLLLTKRIGNVEAMVAEAGGWPDNARLGISVCNQAEALRDIPKAIYTKRALGIVVLFLSLEPLLGAIDLEVPMPGPDLDQGGGAKICQPWLIQSGIDWAIVGGESGREARPMHPRWARDIRDQCERAGVAFLFKQHGEWLPGYGEAKGFIYLNQGQTVSCGDKHTHEWSNGVISQRVGKKAAGRLLDGRTHDEFPEV